MLSLDASTYIYGVPIQYVGSIAKSSVGSSDGQAQAGSSSSDKKIPEIVRELHFDISTFRNDMAIENAFTDGIITDWEIFERTWDYSYAQYLKVGMRETPILMAEKSYNPPSVRQRYSNACCTGPLCLFIAAF
jgi:actin-related protein